MVLLTVTVVLFFECEASFEVCTCDGEVLLLDPAFTEIVCDGRLDACP